MYSTIATPVMGIGQVHRLPVAFCKIQNLKEDAMVDSIKGSTYERGLLGEQLTAAKLERLGYEARLT